MGMTIIISVDDDDDDDGDKRLGVMDMRSKQLKYFVFIYFQEIVLV